MTIEHGAARFEISRELAVRIERESRHPFQRLQVLRACERCGVVCVSGVITCRCCEVHGTKPPGSSRISYPSDGRQHVVLMPIDEFVARFEREGVAA